MSASAYFGEKCVKKLQENIALTIQKHSDPASLVQVDASESLKQAAKGNFGPLADVAGDYLERNADALLVEALKVTGLENTVLDALNLFYNMLAQAMSSYNDLVLVFMKKLAKNIIVELEVKEKINQEMKQSLTNLYNGLLALTSGDPVFEKYLKLLRDALIELDGGRSDIKLVRNTLNSSDMFLGKRYKAGKAKIDSALTKIQPLGDNPYLAPTYKHKLINVGVQTDKQQITNMLAIPVLCKNVITAAQGYAETTAKINFMLVAYYAGLNQLQAGIPTAMKKYILSRFDSTLDKLLLMVKSMALTLNGSETAVYGPVITKDFTAPQPLPVSVLAFKWSMDGALIRESFKLIPTGHVVVSRRANGQARAMSTENKGRRLIAAQTGDFESVQVNDTVTIYSIPAKNQEYKVKAVISDSELEMDRVINGTIVPKTGIDYEISSDALGALQLSFDVVNAYKTSVKNLKSMGTLSSGGATLVATEAQENFIVFSGQLLTFLLEATGAAISAKIRPAAMSQCKGFIQRCDLVTARDSAIRAALQAFIDKPLALEDKLTQIQEGLMAALRDLGLDRAADLLDKGDFAAFFKLNGKNATYVGAALEAIALLKDCFDNDADRNRLSEIENSIKGDAELINFKISFNFDLAIFKNLKDCIDLKALMSLFKAKELLCGLLKDAGVGTLFNKLNDLLSF